MGIKSLAASLVGITLAEEAGPLGDYSANVTPPARLTELTARGALGLPAFFRGATLIAGMGSQLSLDSWRGEVMVNPAPALIRTPDPWRSVRSFIGRTITCLTLHGNAYWRKTTAADGSVIGLEVLDPNTVFIRWDKGVKTYTYTLRGKVYRDRPYTEIEHIWFFEVPGALCGLGPVQAARAALEGIVDLRSYADNWLNSGDQPSGVLSTDQRLAPGEADEYKRIWYSRNPDVEPANGPSLRVLGAGLSYTPYFLKPADAQWIESQQWGVLDIARLLGVPGDYVLAAVEGSNLTYANLEMIDAQFLRTTLFPLYLAPIEEALSRCLPRGQEARFNTRALLRPDAKTRADIDGIYIDKGVYDADYVRTREGIAGPAPTPAPTEPANEEIPA